MNARMAALYLPAVTSSPTNASADELLSCNDLDVYHLLDSWNGRLEVVDAGGA